MFIEIALLQKCALFLGDPLIAATVVIATFLAFAGIGALQVGRWVQSAWVPGCVVAVLVVGYAVMLGWLFELCHAWPMAWRVIAAVVLLAPLAAVMGMMFPLGLGRVKSVQLPWAWAVNGCCSVIGAALAAVLAMDFGFTPVLVTAAMLYAAAGWVYGKL
jgi:hypothetical protein